MATITITPPEAWQKAKDVSAVIVPHLTFHGAEVTLQLDEAGKVVVSATVKLPASVPENRDTEHAKARREQIAKIRQYIQEYGWKEVEG